MLTECWWVDSTHLKLKNISKGYSLNSEHSNECLVFTMVCMFNVTFYIIKHANKIKIKEIKNFNAKSDFEKKWFIYLIVI
jgi:hypothetical protein